jgi:membrane-bound serine protease (ClpP class)
MKRGVSTLIGIVALIIPALARAAATSLPSVATATSLPLTPATEPVRGGNVAIIELAGEIDDYNRDQLFRRFDEARKAGAPTIILDVDTYGGLVTAGMEISRFLKRQTDVHTIAFVKDKAISAGSMISMACDEIVMGQSATLGDCAPIIYGAQGLEAMPAAERAKMESPIKEDFEESARRSGRDLLLADAMVSVDITVYWVQGPDGSRRFVQKNEYDKLIAAGWTDVPGAAVPIDGPTTLLTVDSDHAVMYGLASGKDTSAEALAASRGFTVVATYRSNWGDQAVAVLSSWPARLVLIVILISCANVVIHAPGHGVAEVVGLLALALMLGVPLLTGYATWWEILIIFIGLGLVAIEILLPGHFVPGITGACLVVVGLVMTFVPIGPGGLPSTFGNLQLTWLALQKGLFVVAGGLGCSLFLWFWLNRYLPKLPYFNRLILSTDGAIGGMNRPVAAATASSARTWPMIGSAGRAVTELKPGGSAEFYDDMLADVRVISVVSDSGFVNPGSDVVVREVAGNRVVVRRK